MLPIDEIKPEIQRALARDPSKLKPLIISAPTGSGKSTRLPLWFDEMTDRLVVVVEPRRVACRALATYLSSLRGEAVGQSIGYSVRFEDRTSAKTRVLFVTPGVALRLLQPGQRLADLSGACVLIDEFHERGWETDLLAALLLERFERSPFVLGITSATLDLQSLESSLDADFYEARGRSYPVEISYAGQSQFAPSREGLADRVVGAIKTIVKQDDDHGDVLVFLPGKGEIRQCRDRLQPLQSTHQLQLYVVHSGVPLSELSRILSAGQPGQRRVFLATNIAETSLTVPGITWVVDSGLVRMRMHRGGHTALSLVPTSQASMDQRAGRAGRVAPGSCIRLWDEHYSPQANTSPEVERIELDEVILRAAACGLSANQFARARWIATPPEFAVQDAVSNLKGLGALDDDGLLTDFGQALSRLPVSVYEARMLARTPPELHHTMADLVAILQRGKRLLMPLDMRDETKRLAMVDARRALFDGCQDDISVALRMLREGHPTRHGVNASGLKETRQIAHSLRKLLDPSLPAPHKDPDRPDDRQALVEHLLRHTPESAFVLRQRALKDRKNAKRRSSSQPWTNGTIEVLIDPFEPFDPKDKPQQPAKAGIVLDHIWLGDASGTGTRARGNLLLPCRYQDLADAGLGEVVVHDYTFDKKRRICGVRERTLGQVTIEHQEVRLKGRELCEAVAHLTLENRCFKGLAEPLRDAFHIWRLLNQWESTLDTEHWKLETMQSNPVPEILPYLIEALADLGVQSQADLQLVEHEDLLPDLEAMAGVFPQELDELRNDFPRIWIYQGARYLCTPSPRARKVVMEPANKATKKLKEPPAKHLPRFRGYRVIYKQASRSLTLR